MIASKPSLANTNGKQRAHSNLKASFIQALCGPCGVCAVFHFKHTNSHTKAHVHTNTYTHASTHTHAHTHTQHHRPGGAHFCRCCHRCCCQYTHTHTHTHTYTNVAAPFEWCSLLPLLSLLLLPIASTALLPPLLLSDIAPPSPPSVWSPPTMPRLLLMLRLPLLLLCPAYNQGWPEPYMYTVCDHIFGISCANSAVKTTCTYACI